VRRAIVVAAALMAAPVVVSAQAAQRPSAVSSSGVSSVAVTAPDVRINGASLKFHPIPFFFPGTQTNSQILAQVVMTTSLTIPSGCEGSNARAGTLPTGATTITIKKNGAAVATVLVATTGAVTFTCAADVMLSSGDLLSVHGQATADTTLANLSLTLLATVGTAPALTVSLTFDDTDDNQYTTAAPLLESHGMRATLYATAGRLQGTGDTHGYMTLAQVLDLQRRGFEIGSHGLDHVGWTTSYIPWDRLLREACDSRLWLLGQGANVRAAAFPFGFRDATTDSALNTCGYVTGRDVGSILSTGPYYESIPPASVWDLRAPSSFEYPAGTLAFMQGYVTRALAACPRKGACWLIMNMHNICAVGTTCSNGQTEHILETSVFTGFLDWLQAQNNIEVRTVSQVASGPLKPAVASNTPLVINGSLESNMANPGLAPDCWQYTSSSTNDGAWSVVPGRTGNARQVVMSNYTSGSRRLMQDYSASSANAGAALDFRSCTTPTTVGHSYTLSCWVRADHTVRIQTYHRDPVTSSWVALTSGSSTATSQTDWTQVSYTLTIAAGEIGTLAFGASIDGVCTSNCMNGNNTGTMIVDDCSAIDNGIP
jgi:peptidoglycan/xylan/chitin deacetylase (PgdA/CDA1 family)